MVAKNTEFKVTDYHDFCNINTPAAERQKLNVGDLWINGAVCHICDTYIRSRNRHDYVSCKCGNVSVDGGSCYGKLAYVDIKMVTRVYVAFTDVKDDV